MRALLARGVGSLLLVRACGGLWAADAAYKVARAGRGGGQQVRGAHASGVGVCVYARARAGARVCVCDDAGGSRVAFTGASCTWGGPLLCDRGQGHGASSGRDPSAMRSCVAEAQGGASRRDIEPLCSLLAALCSIVSVCVCASVCCVKSVCVACV